MPSAAKRFVPVTVGIGVNVQLLAANPDRRSAVIVNNSAGIVYVGKDNTVSAANGIPLVAGGSIADTTSGDAWWAFNGQAGTADVRCLEVAEAT
jgi:hypothetical protein